MSWGVVEARIFINEIDTSYPLSLILVICLCNGNLISIKNTTNADAFEHAFRCMVLSDDLYLCTHALTNRVKPFSSMHLWSATRIGQNVTNLPNYKRTAEAWIQHFSSVVHCGKSASASAKAPPQTARRTTNCFIMIWYYWTSHSGWLSWSAESKSSSFFYRSATLSCVTFWQRLVALSALLETRGWK